MKAIRLLALWLITACCAGTTVAAAPAVDTSSTPLLWRIEGETPQYLFGTIHIPDPRVTRLPPVVEKAFVNSQIVVTELKLDMTTMTAAAQASLLPESQKLSALLTPAIKQQLETELKAISKQLRPAMFDRLKLWALATQLALLPMQLKHPGVPALDLQLAQRAETEGKRNEGLERLDEQLGIFDKLSQADQLALLQESLDGLAKARQTGKDVVEQLTEAYLSGSETEVEKLLAEFQGENKALNDRLAKALIDDRNIAMADRISQRLKTQAKTRHFIAVGTAHLVGNNSIVMLLRQKGYTVTRVTE